MITCSNWSKTDSTLKKALLYCLQEKGLNMTNMLMMVGGGAGKNPGYRLNTDMRFSTLYAYCDYIGISIVYLMQVYMQIKDQEAHDAAISKR